MKRKTIVFTNGCFDIYHAGHARLLKRAKALGDFLIVGINSDNSIRRIKGNKRPVNKLLHRIEVISSIKYVNGIHVFDENTPEELIKVIRPNIHVKGGDWKEEDLPEAKIVRSYGGKVIIIPHEIKISTTEILNHG